MNRSDYIGSSDARDILSGNWSYLAKLKKGLIPNPDFSKNFAVQFGSFCEEFHLDWSIAALREESPGEYAYSIGTKSGEQHFAQIQPRGNASKLILGSHPDALLKQDNVVRPLEAKLTGRFKNADEAADFYMPQLQHHMLCWQSDMLLLSVICGTTEPERIWIGASETWQDSYIDRCAEFWDAMESGEAEKAVPSESIKMPQDIQDSVPRNGFKKRDMNRDNRFRAITAEFIDTKEAVKKHEKAKSDLKAMMADDESELYSNDLTLKRDKRGAIRFTIHDT